MNEQTRTLLDMIEKLESRVNAYWNFFSVVALAVSGWLITSKATFTTTQGIVLAIAVVIFFGANLSVVRAATARLLAFEAELNAVAPAATFGSDALRRNLSRPVIPGRLAGSVVLHLAVDIAVLYLIWSKVAEA